jgi:hypothetical protein
MQPINVLEYATYNRIAAAYRVYHFRLDMYTCYDVFKLIIGIIIFALVKMMMMMTMN